MSGQYANRDPSLQSGTRYRRTAPDWRDSGTATVLLADVRHSQRYLSWRPTRAAPSVVDDNSIMDNR